MPKILIVDDEEDMRTTLALLLQGEGYDTSTASNGHKAMDVVKEGAVDLVMCDLRMPDMDGIELLAQIKTLRPSLPVVMVTGYGNAEVAAQSIKLGAYDYLSKPFDNERLFEVVKHGLMQRSLETTAARGGVLEARVTDKLLKKPPLAVGPGNARTPPQPTPHPVHRSSRAARGALFLAPLLALLVGAGWWAREAYFWQERIMLLPTTHPSGLSVSPQGLWISDWLSQSVTLAPLRRFPFSSVPWRLEGPRLVPLTGRQVTGIAVGETFVFTSDPNAKKFYEHDLDAQLTVRREVASPGPSPSGLFWDGTHLWSVDVLNKKIYKHIRDEALTVISEWPSPGPRPIGIGFDGTYLWSADAESKKIYKHLMDESLSVTSTYDVPEAGPVRPAAFTIYESNIWMAGEGKGRLFVFPLSRFP